MSSISACMIVKDEEKLLPQCLDSIKDCADEIILVDTGSTDKTIEVAEAFGANGYKGDLVIEHFEWIDDFSAARNYSTDKATKDWILIIDADEKLHEVDAKAIQCATDDIKDDVIAIDVFNVANDGTISSRNPSLRLFRRSYGIKYDGKVHNKPVLHKNDDGSKPTVVKVPCRLYHYGYGLDEESMKKKYKRWTTMCKRWTKECPDEAYAWYQYGKSLFSINGKFNHEYVDEILGAFETAIGIPHKDENKKNIYIQSLLYLARSHFYLGHFGETVELCDRALEVKPDYIDAMFFAGMACTLPHVSAAKGEKYLKLYLKTLDEYKFEEKFETILMETIGEKNVAYGALADIEGLKKEQVKI